MGRLTERTVQTAKAGRHGDGDGLHLVVSEAGRKKWVLRYQVDGLRRDKGLGSYPDVSLKDARSKASEDRGLIAKGVDPIEQRRASRKASKPVPTFGDIAQIVVSDAQRKSTNAKVRYQWERHLGPALFRPVAGATCARDHDARRRRGASADLARKAGSRSQTLSGDPPRLRTRSHRAQRRARYRHAGQSCPLGRSESHGV